MKCRDCTCSDMINPHLATCLADENNNRFRFLADEERACRLFEAEGGTNKQLYSAVETLNEEIA